MGERIASVEFSEKVSALTRKFDAWGIDTVAVDGDDTIWQTLAHFSQTFADIAGILNTSKDNIDAAIWGTLKEFGINPHGKYISVLMACRWAGFSDDSHETLTALARMDKFYTSEAPDLYEGTIELLDALNATGRGTILATHADPDWTLVKRVYSGLLGKFSDVIAFDIDIPKSVQWGDKLQSRKVDPGRLLVFGDSPLSDMLPIAKLGARGILVENGMTKHYSNETASVSELEPFFQNGKIIRSPYTKDILSILINS